jgi:hypothetical protein
MGGGGRGLWIFWNNPICIPCLNFFEANLKDYGVHVCSYERLYNRVQKLLKQAVYWPSPSCNNGSCPPPPPCAMLLKRFWSQGLSNNMFSTMLMGGGGHAREKDHQNVKSLIIFACDCRWNKIFPYFPHLNGMNFFFQFWGRIKADFQSSHEAPRSSLRVLTSN